MKLGRSKSLTRPERARFAGRFRLIFVAPVLAVLALSAWAFSSPMGAAPDDEFHLVSTWCSTGDDAYCQEGSADSTRLVPEIIVQSPCFALLSNESAACQDSLDSARSNFVETARGNFAGAYPPLYYSVMSIFVGEDARFSVMAMRLFNVLLFVSITSALYALLPISRRPALVWGWLITTVPLGLFLLSSNNPSGWAVAGVGSAWLALIGYYEARKPVVRWLSAFLVIVSVLMAAGSRGDSAVYVVGALGVAIVLVFENKPRFWLLSILPAVMTAVSAAFFLAARQTSDGINGFSGQTAVPVATAQVASAAESLSGFGLLAYNLLNVPSLWMGVFGSWDLGWFDTPLPESVTFLGLAAFVGVGFSGLALLTVRKAFVISAVGFVLWVLPAYVLTQGGDRVGDQVQPRYILPLIVLLGGLLVLETGAKRFALSRGQSLAVVIALSVANLVALHMNLRRYVTGNDVAGWNLDAGAEWFWSGAPTPMVVWAVGAISFAGLVAIISREMGISTKIASAAESTGIDK